jgi:hypothetical protein
MCPIAILEAFAGLEDPRRCAGQRHNLALCLAVFTLAMPQGGLPVRARSWQSRVPSNWRLDYKLPRAVGRAIKTPKK